MLTLSGKSENTHKASMHLTHNNQMPRILDIASTEVSAYRLYIIFSTFK